MGCLASKIILQAVKDIRNQGAADRDRQDATVFLEQAQQEDTWAKNIFDMTNICPVRIFKKLEKERIGLKKLLKN
ncbi:hypothetical protein M1N64_02335 [Peptococcaceae bacterium]|nr:hypothetical protein [Peptococcaceae bacterium]